MGANFSLRPSAGVDRTRLGGGYVTTIGNQTARSLSHQSVCATPPVAFLMKANAGSFTLVRGKKLNVHWSNVVSVRGECRLQRHFGFLFCSPFLVSFFQPFFFGESRQCSAVRVFVIIIGGELVLVSDSDLDTFPYVQARRRRWHSQHKHKQWPAGPGLAAPRVPRHRHRHRDA